MKLSAVMFVVLVVRLTQGFSIVEKEELEQISQNEDTSLKDDSKVKLHVTAEEDAPLSNVLKSANTLVPLPYLYQNREQKSNNGRIIETSASQLETTEKAKNNMEKFDNFSASYVTDVNNGAVLSEKSTILKEKRIFPQKSTFDKSVEMQKMELGTDFGNKMGVKIINDETSKKLKANTLPIPLLLSNTRALKDKSKKSGLKDDSLNNITRNKKIPVADDVSIKANNKPIINIVEKDITTKSTSKDESKLTSHNIVTEQREPNSQTLQQSRTNTTKSTFKTISITTKLNTDNGITSKTTLESAVYTTNEKYIPKSIKAQETAAKKSEKSNSNQEKNNPTSVPRPATESKLTASLKAKHSNVPSQPRTTPNSTPKKTDNKLTDLNKSETLTEDQNSSTKTSTKVYTKATQVGTTTQPSAQKTVNSNNLPKDNSYKTVQDIKTNVKRFSKTNTVSTVSDKSTITLRTSPNMTNNKVNSPDKTIYSAKVEISTEISMTNTNKSPTNQGKTPTKTNTQHQKETNTLKTSSNANTKNLTAKKVDSPSKLPKKSENNFKSGSTITNKNLSLDKPESLPNVQNANVVSKETVQTRTNKEASSTSTKQKTLHNHELGKTNSDSSKIVGKSNGDHSKSITTSNLEKNVNQKGSTATITPNSKVSISPGAKSSEVKTTQNVKSSTVNAKKKSTTKSK